MRIPLAREGYYYIFFSIIAIIICYILKTKILFFISLPISLFLICFFRDPERRIPEDINLIVSPADGMVIKVEQVKEERFPGEDALLISIFMSLFDVHVNRVPATGRIIATFYNPGRFFSANLDKASKENEQNALLVRTDNNRHYLVVQIAGLIARRIVCYVKKDNYIKKGKRFGMIRFGSRLDLYLPLDCIIKAKVGERVKAGQSVLGLWSV